MFALALSLVLFSNCSEDDPAIDDTIDDGTDDGTDDGSATESLLDLLASTEGLDTLDYLVNLYPDVAAVVASASGNYTLFAPTNDAFATLYATVGVAKASDVNKDIVLAILGYHVSGTDYPTLTAGTTISTLVPNETIVVNDDGTLLTGSSNSAIPVISSTEATNGTMHIVESVLIPPTIGSTLTALLGTNAATVLIGGSFTTIGAALTKSEEFAATAGAPSLTAYLAGESSSTVFAVPDAVFEAGGIGVDDLTSQEWYGLISHHIVGKSIKAADLTGDAGQAGIMVNSLLPFPGGEQGSFVPHWIQYIPGKGNFSSVFIDSDVQIITVYMTALALGEDQQGALNAVYAYEAEAGPAIWNAEILYPDAVTNVNGMVHVLYGYLSPYPPEPDDMCVISELPSAETGFWNAIIDSIYSVNNVIHQVISDVCDEGDGYEYSYIIVIFTNGNQELMYLEFDAIEEELVIYEDDEFYTETFIDQDNDLGIWYNDITAMYPNKTVEQVILWKSAWADPNNPSEDEEYSELLVFFEDDCFILLDNDATSLEVYVDTCDDGSGRKDSSNRRARLNRKR